MALKNLGGTCVQPRLRLNGAGRHGAVLEVFRESAGDAGSREAAQPGHEWA